MPLENFDEEAMAATHKDMPRHQAWLEDLEWREMDEITRHFLERRQILQQEDKESEYKYPGDEV